MPSTILKVICASWWVRRNPLMCNKIQILDPLFHFTTIYVNIKLKYFMNISIIFMLYLCDFYLNQNRRRRSISWNSFSFPLVILIIRSTVLLAWQLPSSLHNIIVWAARRSWLFQLAYTLWDQFGIALFQFFKLIFFLLSPLPLLPRCCMLFTLNLNIKNSNINIFS